MWESLFAILLGGSFDYATRNWDKIKRKSIAYGLLTGAIILLLCLSGDKLIPPLVALRSYCDELTWIIGKIVLCLLALPVGIPVGYCISRRWMTRKAEKAVREAELNPGTASSASRALNQSQIKARQIQRLYAVVVGILLWGWYWFLTPARSWLELDGQEALLKTIGLLVLWFLLAAILGVGGGRIVYRLAERHFRRRI